MIIIVFVHYPHILSSLTTVFFQRFTLFILYQILHERQLPGDSLTVQAVSEVLAASQKYMRDQSVGIISTYFSD